MKNQVLQKKFEKEKYEHDSANTNFNPYVEF